MNFSRKNCSKGSVLIIAITFLFTACTRITTTDLGGGLIPAVDGVTTFDTLLDVQTDLFVDTDSLRIYKTNSPVIGNISNDPLFGKTKASLFVEFKPTFYPFTFLGVKDSVYLDSAVLIFKVASIYGDTTQNLAFNVYEVDQQGKVDPLVVYPSNYRNVGVSANVKRYNTVLGSVDVDPRKIKDSIKNRFEASSNLMRIRMSNVFAQRMFNYDSSNAYKSDSLFRTYFAGFAIEPSNNNGNALLQLNMMDTATRFALYYRYDKNGKRDTAVAYLRFNADFFGNSSGFANFIERDYNNSELQNYVNNAGSPDSLLHVQASPGTFVNIQTPSLKTLSNRIVHRAELIVEQVPDQQNGNLDEILPPPRIMILAAYDSLNHRKINIPHDFYIEQGNPNYQIFGGYLTRKAVPPAASIYAYNFNITRYVQGILSRKEKVYDLRMYAPVNDSISYQDPYPRTFGFNTFYFDPSITNLPAFGRIRVGGGTHTRYRMRIRIIYSKI